MSIKQTKLLNTLHGGAGSDTLAGNQNSDLFVYTSASDSLISQPDTITDFTVGSDKLSLNFTGFPPAEIASVNSLKEANDYFKRLFTQPEFSSSESVIVVESLPARSSIQIAFSSSESTLYIDSSAQGVADMAINLEGVTSLNLSDFHSIGNWTLESDRSPALLV